MQYVQIAPYGCPYETPSLPVWRAPPQHEGQVFARNAQYPSANDHSRGWRRFCFAATIRETRYMIDGKPQGRRGLMPLRTVSPFTGHLTFVVLVVMRFVGRCILILRMGRNQDSARATSLDSSARRSWQNDRIS
jgi:hypothetical protein